MLILNTPDGDFVIAKGNIHTIQEDYDVGYYYVTKDIASYPFRSINGIKVRSLEHSFELVKKYADENGEQPIELELDEETEESFRQALAKWKAKAEEASKGFRELTVEEMREHIRKKNIKHKKMLKRGD
jgi:adenylosuccinate synthase